MATVSFTREMRLNKDETERFIDWLNKPDDVNYEITTPPAKEASIESLERLFGKK